MAYCYLRLLRTKRICYNLNFFLNVCQDNKIKASMKEELIDHFQRIFNEKEVFLIENFTVHHYKSNSEQIFFGNKKFVKLHNFTLVTKDDGFNYDIAADSFDFQKLYRIHRFEEHYLIGIYYSIVFII